MNIITLEAISEIRTLGETVPQGKHLVTGDIRRVSARLFRKIEDRRIDHVLVLCEELQGTVFIDPGMDERRRLLGTSGFRGGSDSRDSP